MDPELQEPPKEKDEFVITRHSNTTITGSLKHYTPFSYSKENNKNNTHREERKTSQSFRQTQQTLNR